MTVAWWVLVGVASVLSGIFAWLRYEMRKDQREWDAWCKQWDRP